MIHFRKNERPYVVDFQLFRAAANLTDRMKSQMLLAHGGPMAGARSAERMLAFGSIDKMFE